MDERFGEGLSLLLVDDEPLIVEIMSKLLNSAGFEIESAVTFAEASALIENKRFDLAIFDKKLCDGDGLELARRIDEMDGDCEVAIITGYASLESAIEALRVRVADYFLKPINTERIRSRLQRMVEHQSLRRQHGILVEELDLKNKRVEKLEAQATRDSLTGLFNHAFFQEQMIHEIARCTRYGHDVGLLFLDVDNFKMINDTLGHQVGDRVLKSIAGVLHGGSRDADIRFRLREHDLAARYGGDEFVLLLPETDRRGAAITAERLRKSIEHRDFGPDVLDKITLSIGVASLPADANDRDGLINAADIALYAAKKSGRNRVISFSSAMSGADPDGKLNDLLDIKKASALDEIIENGGISFAYQPIVDAKTLKVRGYEALCRTASNVLPTPLDIIVTAERTGKIDALGRLMRRMVVSEIEKLPDSCSLFVNLHPQELNDPNLVAEDSPLRRHANRVVFEINNSRDITDRERLKAIFVKLHDCGYKIAMDDLCRGYLGLDSLVRLEPDLVKMNIDMLHRVSSKGRASRLIKHYLDYTAGEGITVIATNIETEEQKQIAVYLGCTLLQGHLFAKASPTFSGV
jgi:diguanylate cyclase